MNWEHFKTKAYQRMKEDIEIGYMDKDIIDLIKKFFRLPYAYTKSSCSGRIVLVDAKFPWARDGTIIFKAHRPIEVQEIQRAMEKSTMNNLWANSMGPIIHVFTKDLDSAFRILRIAREAGFKHSGILTKNEEGWLIELTTGVRANVLLKVRDTVIIDMKELPSITRVLNEVLLEGKKRLRILESVLEKELQTS